MEYCGHCYYAVDVARKNVKLDDFFFNFRELAANEKINGKCDTKQLLTIPMKL